MLTVTGKFTPEILDILADIARMSKDTQIHKVLDFSVSLAHTVTKIVEENKCCIVFEKNGDWFVQAYVK